MFENDAPELGFTKNITPSAPGAIDFGEQKKQTESEAKKISVANAEIELTKVQENVSHLLDMLNRESNTIQQELVLMKALYNCQSKGESILVAAGLKRSDVPMYASIMTLSQAGITQIQRDAVVNSTSIAYGAGAYEYNGVNYANEDEIKKVKESDLKIFDAEEKIEANKNSWGKLNKLEASWDKDSAEALASNNLEASHDALVKAKAIMSLRAKLLEDSQKQLEIEEEEAVRQAKMHGIQLDGMPVSNIDELKEWNNSLSEEAKENIPWIKKLSGIVNKVVKNSEDIDVQRQEFNNSVDNHEILEAAHQKYDLKNEHPVTLEEHVQAIRENGSLAGVRGDLVESAVVDAKVADEKEELKSVDLQRAAEKDIVAIVEEELKGVDLQRAVEKDIVAIVEEELKGVDLQRAVEKDVIATVEEELKGVDLQRAVEKDVIATVEEELQEVDLQRAVEKDVIATVEEELQEVDLQRAVEKDVAATVEEELQDVDLQRAVEKDTVIAEQDSTIAEKDTTIAEQDAAEKEACMFICMGTGEKCGIDFNNEAYNTPEKFLAELYRKSLTDSEILNDPEVAEAYEFLKMTYPQIDTTQPDITAETIRANDGMPFMETTLATQKDAAVAPYETLVARMDATTPDKDIIALNEPERKDGPSATSVAEERNSTAPSDTSERQEAVIKPPLKNTQGINSLIAGFPPGDIESLHEIKGGATREKIITETSATAPTVADNRLAPTTPKSMGR